jgi:hypothetical protein
MLQKKYFFRFFVIYVEIVFLFYFFSLSENTVSLAAVDVVASAAAEVPESWDSGALEK